MEQSDDEIEGSEDGGLSDAEFRELQLKLQNIDGATKFVREAWQNDGAEGESVHLLARVGELLPRLIDRLVVAEMRLGLAPIVTVQGMEDCDEVCERCSTSTDEPHDRAQCLEQEISATDYVCWSLHGMLNGAHAWQDLVRERIHRIAERKFDEEKLLEAVVTLSGFVREPCAGNDKQAPVYRFIDHLVEAQSILVDQQEYLKLIEDKGPNLVLGGSIVSRIHTWQRRNKEFEHES